LALRFPIYSLRTTILSHLVLLILSAMVLINVVMLKFSERDLIGYKVQAGRLFLQSIEQGAVIDILKTDAGVSASDISTLSNLLDGALRVGGLSELMIINRQGKVLLGTEGWGDSRTKAFSNSLEALTTGNASTSFLGSTWGAIWFAHEKAILSAPLTFENRVIGSASVCADFSPLYKRLRDTEALMILFILLNTFVLVIFGFYLLSRTVVRPVKRLVRITNEFGKDIPFKDITETSKNEIGQLYRSLNIMLRRLEENKLELRSHIQSLEKANKEIRKAQEEVFRSEKMASIGQIATGVAHEIGNPIGIVLGYVELLKGSDLAYDEKEDFLRRIESEINRISEIIRQLLDFSRPSSGKKEVTRFHASVDEVVSLLEPQPMMSGIDIKTSLDADHDTVWADPARLKQLIVNLLINSAESIGESEGQQNAKTISIETTNRDDSLLIKFSDNGPGVPDDGIERIFDPFYTTKDPGKGTGLGLSVCHSIIDGLQGDIRAENMSEKGFMITVSLPLYHRKLQDKP